MAQIKVDIMSIIKKREEKQVTVPYGDKTIRMRVDVGDDELSMYLQAVYDADANTEIQKNEDGTDKIVIKSKEVKNIITALKALTLPEDAKLWDFIAKDSGAGTVTWRNIFQDVQAKFFEQKTGKDSEDAK